MDVYQVSYIPFVVEPLDFAVVIVSAVLICFLATIYPSRQASRARPGAGAAVRMRASSRLDSVCRACQRRNQLGVVELGVGSWS